MKKEKKRNNCQGSGRTINELNTVLCLTSAYQSSSMIWAPVGYPQKYTASNNIPTVTVQILYFWISLANEQSLVQRVNCYQQMPCACHQDVPSWTCPSQQRQRSQSVGSIGQSNNFSWLPEKGTGNPTFLEELGDLTVSSMSSSPCFCWDVLHPYSRQHATERHVEGLQGLAFWVTGRQIWFALNQLKF